MSGAGSGWRIARVIVGGCLITVAAVATCRAGDLEFRVSDLRGRGVSGVVVTVASLSGAATPVRAGAIAPPAPAIMDQRHLAFVPGVLAVAAGTRVDFPNNDAVSHQVYSFSPAKRFQLKLYKGEIHPPVVFDQPGLIVLGCNIHDSMVGYVYVTDTPYFGTTDAAGTLHLANVPSGEVRLTVWSPYIADPPSSLTRTLHVDDGRPAGLQMQLTRELRAQPQPRPRRADWEY